MIKKVTTLILLIINTSFLFAATAVEDYLLSMNHYYEQGAHAAVDSVYQIAHDELSAADNIGGTLELELELAVMLDGRRVYERSQILLKGVLSEISVQQDETKNPALYSELKSMALYELGYNLTSLSKFDMAHVVCDQAIEACLSTRDTAMLIESYNLSGLIYCRQSLLYKGIEQYNKAFELVEQTSNDSLKMSIMNNIAVQYVEMERNEEALAVSRKMLTLVPVDQIKKVQERMNYIEILNTVGVLLSNSSLYQNAVDTLQIATQMMREDMPEGLKLLVYTNLAKSLSQTEKIDSAQYYYKKALDFIPATHNLANIANLHYLYGAFLSEKQSEFKIAKVYINKSLDFYRKNPAVILYKALQQLAEIEKHAGDYKTSCKLSQEAFNAHQAYVRTRYQKRLLRFEAEFKTKEKEHQLKLMAAEKISAQASFDKKIMVTLLCLIIVILFVVLLIMNARKNKIKYQVNELNLNSEIDRRDIEAKHLLEEMNKKITERYIDGIEDSNRQLAKELHDGICNKLFTLELQLNNKIAPDLLSDLSAVREDVRSFSHKLSIPEFKNISFDKALEFYVDKLRSANLFEIDLFISDEFSNTSLGQAVELELYRIIQESLANIIKHAAAKAVHIAISTQDQVVEVIIEDDGRGYDTAIQSKGIGIRLMKKRAESLQGTIAIESQVGRGALIHFSFPIIKNNPKSTM